MSQPVLDIAQEAANIVGVDVPISLIGNTATFASSMRSVINLSGQALARKRGPFFQGWPALVKEYTFNTVPEQQDYTLPEDFEAMIEQTTWDRTSQWRARGPVTPDEWQQLVSSPIGSVETSPLFRIRTNNQGNKVFSLYPIPSETETIVFEYIGSSWLRESTTSQPLHRYIQADTDVPIFPADVVKLDLIWRFKESRGQPFGTDLALFEMERDKAFSDVIGYQTVNMGRNRRGGRFGGIVPATGFGGP